VQAEQDVPYRTRGSPMKNMMLVTSLLLIAMPGMAATTKKVKALSFKDHVTVKTVKAKPLRSDNLSALINRVTVTENFRKPAIESTKSI